MDKPALSPLPAERFDLSEWSRARVNIDYHIAFDTNYYSVPYNLVQELVEVRSTPTIIEIFHKSQRVASHLRAHGHGHAVTIVEHRPRSHQAHLEWTPSRDGALGSDHRPEAAAERARRTGACHYQSVKSILKNSLDAIPTAAPPPSSPPPLHDNICGAEYFE